MRPIKLLKLRSLLDPVKILYLFVKAMEGSQEHSNVSHKGFLNRSCIDQDPDYNEAAPPDLKRLKLLEENGNSLPVLC